MAEKQLPALSIILVDDQKRSGKGIWRCEAKASHVRNHLSGQLGFKLFTDIALMQLVEQNASISMRP